MIDFGNTLRQAREVKGYTASQLAEKTHLSPQAIEALETENFGSIAAPIYGRGFVRIYCEAVGIDAKPMMDEFTALYNGARESDSRHSHAAARPAAERPQTGPAPVPGTERLGAENPAPTAADAPAPDAADVSAQDAPARYARPQSPSRYAPPAPGEPRSRIPRLALADLPWRLVALAAVAILALWALIAGVRAIFRAVTSPAETPAVERASAPAATGADAPSAADGARPGAKRQPQDIPPLYLD